ncbi:glycosyltransferase [Escherichia albertii]|uniref:Glycosyltransferase n=1 Tax=Escherichia albertii TaxID=208962 RepID=A0A5A4U4Z5_ESCAL|nr:glycosyltransferase [Escherichia albertii]BBM63105.1 glycosyltransferase [Escherichia albertii]
MSKRIIFVITGLGLGGAEKQICLLADKLYLQNNEVNIVVLNGDINVIPLNKNIRIYNLHMKKNPLGLLSAVLRLVKIIDFLKPDIVHGHMFHANIVARLAKLFSCNKYKLVCTAHSKNEGGHIRMLVYRLTDFLCNITTNVSKEALDVFIKKKAFSKLKSIPIYNGIDTDIFRYDPLQRDKIRHSLNITNDDTLILSVGRLTDAKDYPNLLKALLELPEKYKLVIIGEGEARNEVECMILNYGLEKRVKLLGSIANVAIYYSACDIYVSSSKWEGFGLVVAEAMSCQRLVVATNAGGVAEVVGDMNYIVPVSDSQLLAKKINEVMEYDKDIKMEIMLRNREFVLKMFSIDMIVNQWIKLYASI